MILHEVTVDRLRELGEQLEIDTRQPDDIVQALVERNDFDHDDALEFCTRYELKDVCRAFDLTAEGSEAESLRQRIRVFLYFPPPTASFDCPNNVADVSKRRDRQWASRDREHVRFRRRLTIRYALGTGLGLFLFTLISPLHALPSAVILSLAGMIAAAVIVQKQLDHLGGSLVLGCATIGATLVGLTMGWCTLDLFLWLIATACGGLVSLAAGLATEVPNAVPKIPIAPERRPLMDLIRMLPDPRLNSLALDLDVELPEEPSREVLLDQIATHGTFDRDRVLRNMEEPDLRTLARRLEMPEGDGDHTEHELRSEILRRFEIAIHTR